MKRMTKIISFAAALFFSCAIVSAVENTNSSNKGNSMSDSSKSANPVVELQTSLGNIDIELNPEKAPVTVKNFLQYVNSGFYDGTIFHRVIKGFMIQGGGFTKDLDQKDTQAPIAIESSNGLKNDKYTIAMARTSDPNSATSQFFINSVNNDFLNFTSTTMRGYGYAVFGKVIKGMDVVDKIGDVETSSKNGMGDVPVKTVTIIKASVLPAK